MVAERLKRAGLIKNKYLFLALIYQAGLKGKIQAGSFELSPAMNSREIAYALTKGRLDRWLTVVEGLRREEIALVVKKQLGVSFDDFLSASQGQEGYLFPDSFLIPVNAGAENVVEIMRKTFDEKTKDLWPVAEEKGLTQNKVVILASLVEREAKKDIDRPLVAGILLKRLENNWLLQVDATVQYVQASLKCQAKKEGCDWWPQINSSDLKINSLYNTYQRKGLPPAPICNPSFSSLKAVVDYQDSPFWFYLSDKNGKIHFAKTLAEHQENIARFLK